MKLLAFYAAMFFYWCIGKLTGWGLWPANDENDTDGDGQFG